MGEDVPEAPATDRRCVGVLVDEMEDVDDELNAARITAPHLAGRRSWPLFTVAVRLPSRPSRLGSVRSYSPAQRIAPTLRCCMGN